MVAPRRDWCAAPGCRRGARYLIDRTTFRPIRDGFLPFPNELACRHWIAMNRAGLGRALPGAGIEAVRLDRWLLGLD